MTQQQVERLLKLDPGVAKEISLNDGQRYRIRGVEPWLAGPWLTILQRGDYIHISYRNIASIRALGGGRRAPRR